MYPGWTLTVAEPTGSDFLPEVCPQSASTEARRW
jgi:hypothetical protein